MPEDVEKEQRFAGIVLRFVLKEVRDFPRTCAHMLRHPFAFFDGKDAAAPSVVYKALEFFFISLVVQKVLWFFSMLPELPGQSEFVPEEYRAALLFMNLFISGLIWHLLLRAVRRRPIALRGTMAVLLYNAGFVAVLLIPFLVAAKLIVSTTTRWLGGDPVLLFVLLLMPFVAFVVYVLCRWMASYHGVRKIVVFLTMVAAEGIWRVLREYIVVPMILLPIFDLVLELYKKLLYLLVGTDALISCGFCG